ncbi:MAG: hypothetical protein GY758_20325 [Fuerstiella sp.]|nr:hypothetical protein [Fuerstiella sp.]MCP4787403.1 hypothetical protein [Fuerstiella sp.]MCP4856619.1 hypothetical protein [Fuerstiella sp.]
MTYITDNPLPLLILIVAVAVVSFLSGVPRGKSFTAVLLLAGIGLYFLEQYLVSPAEKVEHELHVMLDHFKSENLDGITSQISAESPALAEIAEKGLDLVDLSDTFHIKSINVTVDEAETEAVAMVRANGNLTLTHHGGATHRVPNYWRTVWKTEEDTWKLVKVTRLNPVNGTEMGYFSAQ